MNCRFALAFLMLTFFGSSTIISSQQIKKFDPKTYPPQRFQVSHRDYPLGQFMIRIIHVKRKSDFDTAPPALFCRAWMEVRSGGRILHQVYFRDIDAVGGSFGIFLPQNQPFKNFFIALKEGDYDGRLLMVDKEGNLFNFPGGGYFITADKRFIVGEHDLDDGGALVVIDIAERKVVIDG
jgi:hypothetical protein